MSKPTEFFNPFSFLADNEVPRPFKFSRFLYQSFKDRLLDTFYVISGCRPGAPDSIYPFFPRYDGKSPRIKSSFGGFNKGDHQIDVGIFDYLTLGIFWAMSFLCLSYTTRQRFWLTFWRREDWDGPRNVITSCLLIFVVYPLLTIRFLMSSIMMLFALLFIVPMHKFLLSRVEKEQQNLNQPVSAAEFSKEWEEMLAAYRASKIYALSYRGETLMAQAMGSDGRFWSDANGTPQIGGFACPVTFEAYAYLDKIPSLLRLYLGRESSIDDNEIRSMMSKAKTGKQILRVLGKHPKIPTDVMGHILSYAFPLARTQNSRIEEVDDSVNEALYNARPAHLK